MAPQRCIDPSPGNIIMSIMSIVSLMSIMYIIHIMLPADQPGYHRRMSEFDEPFHLHTLRCEHVWSFRSISQGHFSRNHEKVSYSWLHHIHTPGSASCSFSRHKWGTRQSVSSFRAFAFQIHEDYKSTLQQEQKNNLKVIIAMTIWKLTVNWIAAAMLARKWFIRIEKMKHGDTKHVQCLGLLKYQPWICTAKCPFWRSLHRFLSLVLVIYLVFKLWSSNKAIHGFHWIYPV